ncbi:hypothetical protein Q3G72_000193 [Acer saccharum]|nr:hypothetical protein Q3G72_000193 [Acer saccharum]
MSCQLNVPLGYKQTLLGPRIKSALLVCNEKDLPSQSKKPNPDKNPSAVQLPEAKTILINDLDALKIVILKCSTEMNLKVQGVTTKEWRFKPGRDSHMCAQTDGNGSGSRLLLPSFLLTLNAAQLRMGTITGPSSHKLWCLPSLGPLKSQPFTRW